MAKITLFAQIAQHLPKNLIKKAIRELCTDKHAKGFDTWSHLVSMVFCQFAGCGSLRDISNGLKSATGNLNHLGISRAPSKSTLSYQNEHRTARCSRKSTTCCSSISDSRPCSGRRGSDSRRP